MKRDDVDDDVDADVAAELADLEGMGHSTLKREKVKLNTQFDTIRRNAIMQEAEDELADLLS